MKCVSKSLSLFLLGAFLLMILATSALYGGKKDQNPTFYLSKKSVDLGDFYEGEDVNYTFVIHNTGKADLNIINVRPG